MAQAAHILRGPQSITTYLRLCFFHAQSRFPAALGEAALTVVLYAPAVHLTQHAVRVMDGKIWALHQHCTFLQQHSQMITMQSPATVHDKGDAESTIIIAIG